jgi:hypothetical protein
VAECHHCPPGVAQRGPMQIAAAVESTAVRSYSLPRANLAQTGEQGMYCNLTLARANNDDWSGPTHFLPILIGSFGRDSRFKGLYENSATNSFGLRVPGGVKVIGQKTSRHSLDSEV